MSQKKLKRIIIKHQQNIISSSREGGKGGGKGEGGRGEKGGKHLENEPNNGFRHRNDSKKKRNDSKAQTLLLTAETTKRELSMKISIYLVQSLSLQCEKALFDVTEGKPQQTLGEIVFSRSLFPVLQEAKNGALFLM